MYRFHVTEVQVRQAASLLLSQFHDPSGHVMGIAKWHTKRAHQPICQIGRCREPPLDGGQHGLGIGLQIGDHPGGRLNAETQRVDCVEQRLLIFLHVLSIRHRQALHHYRQRGEGAEDAPGLAPHQFGGVGIALLRHDRGSGGERIGKFHEAELLAGPNH